MPDIATHAQFGALVRPLLAQNIQDCIAKYPDLFQMGLQGPDILFHYRAIQSTPISQLGNDIHARAGYDFFAQIANLSPARDGAQLVYLLGAVVHYALDRSCHPYVNVASNHNTATHYSIESDLDLHIMRTYGLSTARRDHLPKQVPVPAIAACYGLPVPVVQESFDSMHRDCTLIAKRKMITWGANLLGKPAFANLCLKDEVQHVREVHDLFILFTRAQALAVQLVEQAFATCLAEDASKLTDFAHNFEGEIAG